jgi:hypothetical protein
VTAAPERVPLTSLSHGPAAAASWRPLLEALDADRVTLRLPDDSRVVRRSAARET